MTHALDISADSPPDESSTRQRLIEHLRRVHGYACTAGSDANPNHWLAQGTSGERLRLRLQVDHCARQAHVARLEIAALASPSAPELLLYYVPGDELIYWVQVAQLKRRLPEWNRRAVRGRGTIRYAPAMSSASSGASPSVDPSANIAILVPLTALEHAAFRVESI